MKVITLNFNKYVPLPAEKEEFPFHYELYKNMNDICWEYRPKMPNIDYKMFLDADLVITIGTLHRYEEDGFTNLLDLNNLYADFFMHISGCLGIPMLSVAFPQTGMFMTTYDTHKLVFPNQLAKALNQYKLKKNSKVIVIITDKSACIADELFKIYNKVIGYLRKKYV